MELMTSWEKKGFERGIEKWLIKVTKQMLAGGYTI